MKKFLLFYIFLVANIFAQVTTEEKIEYIEKIYRNLEYNTLAFNDLKKTWTLTDPMFVREIFNRFVVSNALRIEGKKPSSDTLKALIEDIFGGYVFIELKKRYYDNEIELLRFFTESSYGQDTLRTYFFDEFNDPVFIKSILGEKVYDDLKSRMYAHTDLSKSFYDSKEGYKFDIYLNIHNPELRFYNLTTNDKNKFLISAFGKWGNDYALLPGWYDPHYIIGLKLRYIDYLINNQPNSAYNVEFGLTVDARWPAFNFSEGEYGRRVFSSGNNFFIHFDGNPLKLIWPQLNKVDLHIDGKFALSMYESKNYDINYISQFFSNRNYFNFIVKYKNLTNLMDLGAFNVGLGVSVVDFANFYLDPQKILLIDVDKDGKKFRTMVVGEAGIENFAGLLQHRVYLQLNYDFVESNFYAGLKTQVMISNTIGFDFKYFRALVKPSGGLPFFRFENYLVFSPIIRINY